LHEWLRPENYLEIGVYVGSSLVLSGPPTVAVGVDPEPRLLDPPNTVCKIFPMTSDHYFATRDVRRDIEADSLGVAFIDGLHLFEQALRDFINIERVSGPTTLALIHDTFAIDELTAEREQKTAFWTGDVWKIVPCLREVRPDLRLFTIPSPPSGVTVVSGLNANSTVLTERFNEIVSHYGLLPFQHDEVRRKECAAMASSDWKQSFLSY